MTPYTIYIECDNEHFWRYNIAVTGEVTQGGQRVEFIKYLDEVAPVGSNLPQRPDNYSRPSRITIDCKAGDALTLYIYVIPHTLPLSREVGTGIDFELRATIRQGNTILYNRHHIVNPWVGNNIEIRL
jgi:hypothetical protein